MSAGASSHGGGQGGDQDFELNLASIIDCFTVLITYLLVSASFITLGTLDVTVATPSDQADAQDPPPADVAVTIRVAEGGSLRIEVSGRENRHIDIPARQPGQIDVDTFDAQLQEIHARYPAVDGAQVAADDAIRYRQLVQVVERSRAVLPKVSLTGEGA